MRSCLLIVLSLLFSPPAAAAPPDLGARIDRVMADVAEPDAPGCAVAVISDGKIIHQRGYGLADLERGVPITPDTLFDIASTSKQFTAAATFLLAADAKLVVDADVRTYLPELPEYGGQVITLRHLLNHTSGLRDYGVLLGLAGWGVLDHVGPSDALAMMMRQRALETAPGEHFTYNNTGFVLLTQVIEGSRARPSPGSSSGASSSRSA